MSVEEQNKALKKQIQNLQAILSEKDLELESIQFQLEKESEKHLYYQLIADFAFAWELWFDPAGKIKYCSPSCYDLTGFSANQIINSSGVRELLVYQEDKAKFSAFLSKALAQTLVSQSLEFRILTLTKQIRWCLISVRGVYDKKGKYLGIRASVQDITRLKNAMGHIQQLEEGKQFELRTKQRLQTELELKDRELVAFLLQLSQKNELLAKANYLLEKSLSKDGTEFKSILGQLQKMLKNTSSQHLDWNMVEKQIEKSHPGFLARLQVKHPRISEKDRRLCAYVRLGLSSKEIAGLLNLTPKSVEIARVRLRKKLQLPSKLRLSNYLSFL
jgi:PAS domain S-box-containing protein